MDRQSHDWNPKHHCCSCTGSGGSDVTPERPSLGAGCSGRNPPATRNTSSGCRRSGLPGNKHADALTKEATGLIQQDTPFDARTLAGATARRAKRSWLAGRPKGWHRSIMADSEPPRRCGAPPERRRWTSSPGWATGGRSEQYHHRIGRRPTDKCQQCSDTGCPAVRCLVCRVATDTPAHILLECPYLLGLRLRSIGNIFVTESDIRKGDVAANSSAGYTVYKSRGRYMERIELEILSHIAENIG